MADLNQRMQAALARAGGRMTRQRRVILEVLQESAEHLTAKEIFLQAHARDPQVTLSTVYRTLELGTSLGVVRARKLSQEHGPEWYEACAGEDHYHFICLQCKEVTEFDAPEVAEIVRRLAAEQGIREARASLAIYGVCARCSAQTQE